MLTIAKHQVKDYVTKDDIDEVYRQLTYRLTHMQIVRIAYEISPKYKQLHAHVIVLCRKKVYYKDNCSLKGFRLQWSPIYDYNKTVAYLKKDAHNKYAQEAILIQNQFNNINMFRKGAVTLEL